MVGNQVTTYSRLHCNNGSAGHVSLQEFIQAYTPADDKEFKDLEAVFRESELSGDHRLSLGGKMLGLLWLLQRC